MKYDGWYIIENRVPIPMASALISFYTWRDEQPESTWVVGKFRFLNTKVSTVFLGFDHNYYSYCLQGVEDEFTVPPEHRPILFETLIFGGPLDGQGERYYTWEEARLGHLKWCAKAIFPTFCRFLQGLV